jgi:hypothetical protein
MPPVQLDLMGNFGFRDFDDHTTVRFSHRSPLVHDRSVVRFVFDQNCVYVTDLTTAITAYSLVGGKTHKIERGSETQFVGQHKDLLLVEGPNPTFDGDAIQMLDKQNLEIRYWFDTAQYPFYMDSDRNLLAVAALGTGCVLLSLWSEGRHRNRLIDVLEEDFDRFVGDSWTGGSFLLTRINGESYLSAWTDSFDHAWSQKVTLGRKPPMGIFVSDETVWLSSGHDLHSFSKSDGLPTGKATFTEKIDGLYRKISSDLTPHTFFVDKLVPLGLLEHKITQQGQLSDLLADRKNK